MMWGRKSKISLAKTAAVKAGVNAYIGRKLKKRNNRGLQQMRIGAAAKSWAPNIASSYQSLKNVISN